MQATFVLLVLAICAVWLPTPRSRGPVRVPLWAVLYAAATATAVGQGVLQAPAVAALLLLVALAVWVARSRDTRWHGVAWVMLLVLCAGLALHRLPGFLNPIAIDGHRFAADAKPFTQRLNFDKGSVGLMLLALLAPRLRRGDELGRLAATTALVWVGTTAVVLGVAVAGGVVRPDFKLPPQTLQFLLVNLFLTCVAEQAMFRLLVQDPLRRALGASVAVLLSAALFGLVHAGGGLWMVLLAGVAGLGHGIAYQRTQRIEAAILVHFGLNATHFLAFTYPALALR